MPCNIIIDIDVNSKGAGGEIAKRRERSKLRRRRTEHLMPRLTIVGVEGEVIECQLETSKQSTVSFKFSQHDDHPDDIADNLVIIHKRFSSFLVPASSRL